MQLVNLTPHEIIIVRDGERLAVPPSGVVARVAATRRVVATIDVDGMVIPVNRVEFGQVENLPEPQAGTWYIVSAIVAQAVPERDDLVIPDDAVRDDQGRIIGARALARV
jgi:hypothetical protein